MTSSMQNNEPITQATTVANPSNKREIIAWNRHRRQDRTVSDWIVDSIIAIIVIAVIVAIIYPLWFIIIASFSSPTAVSIGDVTFWPKGTSLTGYAKILTDTRIWMGYRNT
ncbi:MAG: carbohydrate ABC transporter permease, partial [Bifidobacterium sp.]